MRTRQPFRDPLSLTTHFMAPALPGEDATLRVAVLKQSRRSATATAQLDQAGRARAVSLCTFGDLATQHGASWSLPCAQAPPTCLPPPESCVSAYPEGLPADVRIASRVELLVDPASDWARGFAAGRTGDEPAFEGWLRFADGREPCLRSLALLSDATPPPLLNVLPAAWMPTVELTTHFRARPAKNSTGGRWVAVRARAVHLDGGAFCTEHEVWDAGDAAAGRGPRLCAMSRQLARVVEAKDGIERRQPDTATNEK
eukprot:g3486.t1